MEELDLKELLSVLWNKKTEIVLVILIFMVIGVIYSFGFVTPEYKSSTTLVLATLEDDKSSKSSETAITQTDLTLNSNLVSTYSELIKSKTILREVIDNLHLTNINETQLKNKIKVSAVSDTEIIEIAVMDKKATEAADIANEIAKVFIDKVGEIYNINNVHVVDKAEKADIPYNVNHVKDIVIFAFIGLVLEIIKILMIYMLDNTVKTEQDVEKTTGLLVLAEIPEFTTGVKKGGRK